MTVAATLGTLNDEEESRPVLPVTEAEALRELTRLETTLYVSFINHVGDGPEVAADAIRAQLSQLDARSRHGYIIVNRSTPTASGPFGTSNNAVMLTVTITAVDYSDWERYVEILKLYHLSVEWRRDRLQGRPV